MPQRGALFHLPTLPRRTNTGSVADPRLTAPEKAGAKIASDELSVLVASDDPFSRKAFSTAARAPGISVLDASSVTDVAGHLAARLDADVIVLDAQITAVEALQAIRRLSEQVPRSRILAFSAPATTSFGLLCMNAGASGYLSKETDLAVLPRVLRSANRGEAIISREFATDLVRALRERSHRGPPSREVAITATERRVLELFRTGRTLPEAAAELRISVSTAGRHYAAARRKLAAPAVREASTRNPSGGAHRFLAQARETT
jgi:DNA-binding NarL/FixJ family response regulator